MCKIKLKSRHRKKPGMDPVFPIKKTPLLLIQGPVVVGRNPAGGSKPGFVVNHPTMAAVLTFARSSSAAYRLWLTVRPPTSAAKGPQLLETGPDSAAAGDGKQFRRQEGEQDQQQQQHMEK